MLGLRQPLFDGGLTREAVALAKRRAQQSEVAIELAEQVITQQVETFYASHQAAAAGSEAVRDALLR